MCVCFFLFFYLLVNKVDHLAETDPGSSRAVSLRQLSFLL